MIGRTNTGGGGGGGGLNFQVVGGTTAPSNPRENTIWINTATKITSWSFSATEPENMANGEVWFATGTSSPGAFNALKKNGIEVYPMFAKQCVDGELVDVTARTYQDGEWVEWYDGELYSYGNEYEDISGGWALSSNYNQSHGDVLTKGEYSMIFESSVVGGSHYANGFLRPNNKIDISNANSVILDVENAVLTSETNSAYLCVKSTDNAEANNRVASIVLTSGQNKTFTLDVSTLTGSYYVGVAYDANYGGKIEIVSFKIK